MGSKEKKYFHPRFATVLSGQEIKWINHDRFVVVASELEQLI
jgi:hypothetical protein